MEVWNVRDLEQQVNITSRTCVGIALTNNGRGFGLKEVELTRMATLG